MIDESVSELVIFIANISVIGILVILHIGVPLDYIFSHETFVVYSNKDWATWTVGY